MDCVDLGFLFFFILSIICQFIFKKTLVFGVVVKIQLLSTVIFFSYWYYIIIRTISISALY